MRWACVCGGRRAGLLSALILAITPLHAQHSHFLTVDVPATFWVVLSLLWSARLATGDPKPLRAALLAGAFAGFAAATKYNMALVILPLLAACFLTSSPSRFGRVGACAGVGAFLLAFLLSCPGAVLESGKFLSDLRFEAIHVQNRDDPTFRDTGNGFLYHITHNLDAGLGLPLLVLTLVSIGYALYRRERGDGLLAAFALPYYILISLAAVRYARYTIPLLPILALWTGRMLADGSRLPHPVLWRLAVAGGAVVQLATIALTFLLILPMAETDPRDDVSQGYENFYGFDAPVGFPVQPWFGTVPISPYFPMPGLGYWQQYTPPEIQQRIVYSGKDWDIAALQAQKPRYVILSEYDYDDVLRLKDPAARAYLSILTQNYSRRLIFPAKYQDAPDFPTGGLPHDMTYTNPIISVYERKQ